MPPERKKTGRPRKDNPLYKRPEAESSVSRRSYTREEKLAVVFWIQDKQNWVYDPQGCRYAKLWTGLQWDEDLRPPNMNEVREKFDWKDYCPSCISLWWRSRDSILYGQRARSRRHFVAKRESWPILEEAIYQRFCDAREQGKRISVMWFKRLAGELYQAIYFAPATEFGMSSGWFFAFRRRYGITWRAITKQAQQLPTDLLPKAENFIRFIRRQNNLFIGVLKSPYTGLSRFPYMAILNLDETPIPYEYADGHTYHYRGATTVQYKITRSGWQNRQATVILIISACGQVLDAVVIFHGVPGGTIERQERASWATFNVEVYINEKAWNNAELMVKWIQEHLKTYMDRCGVQELLLVMDSVKFHLTEEVRDALKKLHVVLAVVPAGCTSILQPLDTHINKVFKRHMKDATERLMEGRDQQELVPRTLRYITVEATSCAVRLLSPALIQKAFIQTGISLPPDGSQDNLIKLKQLPSVSWEGWENSEDPIVCIKHEFNEVIDVEAINRLDGEYEWVQEDPGADAPPAKRLPRTAWRAYINWPLRQLKEILRSRKVIGYTKFTKEQCLQRLWDDDTEFAAYQDARQPPPPPLQEISINKPPRIKTIATTDWEERELARGNTFTSTFDLQSWVALGKSSQSFNSQDSAYASQPEQQPQHQEISIQTSYLQSQQPQFTIYEDAGAGSDVDAAGSTDDEATCGNIPTSPQPYVSPPPHI